MLQRSIQKHKREVFWFLTTGVISAIAYFITFSLLWKIFNLNYQVAITIGYIVSVIVHFNINRYITFKSGSNPIAHQLIKYLMMLLMNYIVTLLIAHGVVEKAHFSPYFAIVCSIGATVGTSYLLSRYWVFDVSS